MTDVVAVSLDSMIASRIQCTALVPINKPIKRITEQGICCQF